MIRRTLKSGLLATVAVLAFLPTAAGAAAASAATPHSAPIVGTQNHVRHTHPVPYRIHHHRRALHRLHHRVHLRAHHARRMYGVQWFRHLTAREAAYRCRFIPRTAAHRRAVQAAPYRFAAHRTPYRLVRRATGRVAIGHGRLNVRSGPGTGYRVIGHRHANRLVGLTCKTRGSSVAGNRIWYRLAHHRGYVSAHYVRADRTLPWC